MLEEEEEESEWKKGPCGPGVWWNTFRLRLAYVSLTLSLRQCFKSTLEIRNSKVVLVQPSLARAHTERQNGRESEMITFWLVCFLCPLRVSLNDWDSSSYSNNWRDNKQNHEFVLRFAYGKMNLGTTYGKPYANLTKPRKNAHFRWIISSPILNE